MNTNEKPLIWTIAGADCSSGAGISADLATACDLGVHAASIITTVTAQNSRRVASLYPVSPEVLSQQIEVLCEESTPAAIKLGLLGSAEIIEVISDYLKSYSGHVICDPVLHASVGTALIDDAAINAMKDKLLPKATLLTPNIPEAEYLVQMKIGDNDGIQKAAQKLLALGPHAVLIKGGHRETALASDYFTDGRRSFWINTPRINNKNARGTGCSLSTAITAALALNYSLEGAIVLAKMVVQAGIRTAYRYGSRDILGRAGFPSHSRDLPWITFDKPREPQPSFPACDRLGFYPIADSVSWVRRLLSQGVRTIQLRIKNKNLSEVEDAVAQSVAISRQYNAKLFINDEWKLAIKHGAYGVHLGQGDLDAADVSSLHRAGLRLGISTHSLFELARAHYYRPSYIAFGPIYETTTKSMPFAPQGLDRLRDWCRLSPYPVVAIGGIGVAQLPEVLQTGVSNVAVISAVSKALDPDEAVRVCLEMADKSF